MVRRWRLVRRGGARVVAGLVVVLAAVLGLAGLFVVDAASQCALAAASSDVQGAIADHLPVALPPPPRLAGLEEHEPPAPAVQTAWAATGRAPPPAPS